MRKTSSIASPKRLEPSTSLILSLLALLFVAGTVTATNPLDLQTFKKAESDAGKFDLPILERGLANAFLANYYLEELRDSIKASKDAKVIEDNSRNCGVFASIAKKVAEQLKVAFPGKLDEQAKSLDDEMKEIEQERDELTKKKDVTLAARVNKGLSDVTSFDLILVQRRLARIESEFKEFKETGDIKTLAKKVKDLEELTSFLRPQPVTVIECTPVYYGHRVFYRR